MDTDYNTIGIKPFPLHNIADAVKYCLPYDDVGHQRFNHTKSLIIQRGNQDKIDVFGAVHIFINVINGTEFADEKMERFVGFLCGERIGHYETIQAICQDRWNMMTSDDERDTSYQGDWALGS